MPMFWRNILSPSSGIRNEEELHKQWKESIIVPIYKKSDKTDHSNNQGKSLTTYKTLSNILLSRLTPYVDKITGVHQCGFQYTQSTTDLIFCIFQILQKKCE
jgi:hypothetical protein